MTTLLAVQKPEPDWHAVIPTIFTNPQQFIQTGRRRYQVGLDGKWAGIAVAFRPLDRDNYGLNCEDLERLTEKIRDGSLDAGFVVLATIGDDKRPAYVAHRDGQSVYDSVKVIPPRNGQYGSFWLLRGDFSLFDDLAIARERF